MENKNKIKMFVDTLLSTNRGYNFFIDWKNIEVESSVELCAINSLIGCKSNIFKEKFYELLDKLPTVVAFFPMLLAISKSDRDKLKKGKSKLEIIDFKDLTYENYEFDLKKIKRGFDNKEKEKYYNFFENTGLKNLFENIIKKSVSDYIVGVLVGLDSHGRKNRSGKIFENLCEEIISPICNEYGIVLLKQQQFKKLKTYGLNINDDIKNRKADFILIKDKIVLNIEVNYYFEAGSKPEEIVDSYINRNKELENNGINFILITDGNCWNNKGKNQLTKAFKNISLMNYKMSKQGHLKDKIKEIFNLK